MSGKWLDDMRASRIRKVHWTQCAVWRTRTGGRSMRCLRIDGHDGECEFAADRLAPAPTFELNQTDKTAGRYIARETIEPGSQTPTP